MRADVFGASRTLKSRCGMGWKRWNLEARMTMRVEAAIDGFYNEEVLKMGKKEEKRVEEQEQG